MDIRKLFHCLIYAEISCFLLLFAVPSAVDGNSVSDSSVFADFWNGLWYLLFVLWVLGWTALLRGWSRGPQIYLAGWAASLIYCLLGGAIASSALASTLGSLTSLLGGAILVLLYLRKTGLIHWVDSSEEKI